MNINDYCKWTENTCAKLDNQVLDTIHMLMGMTTEVGELTDPFKKQLAYNKEIDWVNINEEIGDLIFYIASFCRINNLNLEKIIETNIEKLETRYPDKFTQDKAINRNLENERKILRKILDK
jgi:NTP pyrophosphatase (non-canonical NTP hydrolase)